MKMHVNVWGTSTVKGMMGNYRSVTPETHMEARVQTI